MRRPMPARAVSRCFGVGRCGVRVVSRCRSAARAVSRCLGVGRCPSGASPRLANPVPDRPTGRGWVRSACGDAPECPHPTGRLRQWPPGPLQVGRGHTGVSPQVERTHRRFPGRSGTGFASRGEIPGGPRPTPRLRPWLRPEPGLRLRTVPDLASSRDVAGAPGAPPHTPPAAARAGWVAPERRGSARSGRSPGAGPARGPGPGREEPFSGAATPLGTIQARSVRSRTP